jgi:hypothetical protein
MKKIGECGAEVNDLRRVRSAKALLKCRLLSIPGWRPTKGTREPDASPRGDRENPMRELLKWAGAKGPVGDSLPM